MGLLDGLLGQVAGNVDIQNLAAKVGLTPDQVEQAVTALGQAHPQPGDTVQTAADQTGLRHARRPGLDVRQQGVSLRRARHAAVAAGPHRRGGRAGRRAVR